MKSKPFDKFVFKEIIKFAGKSLHSLTLKNDGTVWAWGDNWTGQLGNGATSDSNISV
jgi:alpha-tubulin suppressor-like RCC1 family protein